MRLVPSSLVSCPNLSQWSWEWDFWLHIHVFGYLYTVQYNVYKHCTCICIYLGLERRWVEGGKEQWLGHVFGGVFLSRISLDAGLVLQGWSLELLTRLMHLKCRSTQISELKSEIRGGGRSKEYISTILRYCMVYVATGQSLLCWQFADSATDICFRRPSMPQPPVCGYLTPPLITCSWRSRLPPLTRR